MKKPKPIITSIRITFDVPINQAERVLGYVAEMNDGDGAPPPPRPSSKRRSGDERQMLSIDELLRILPLSRTTLFRMEKSGEFPRSHQLSPNKRFWYEDEITKWKNTRNRVVKKLPPIKKRAAKKRRAKR